MRLEWLEDILAVVDTGSFSEAAERRFITQSAFSRRIRLIEDYVGIELFDRTRKPVQLNAATRAQEARIRELTSDLRLLMNDLRSDSQTAANRIVLVTQHAIATAQAPAVISDLVEKAGLAVRLRSANLDECYAMLLNHAAELAIVYRTGNDTPPGRQGFFEVIDIGEDRLIPVSAPGRSDAALQIVAYPKDVYLGQLCEREIFPGLVVTRRAETALTTAALELAKSGVGTAWVPRSLAASSIESGAVVHLTDLPSLPLKISAARLADTTSSAEDRAWKRLQLIKV